MSAGDLKGHLRKLDNSLRLIKYPRDVDYNSLSNGDPSAFLPIVSYALTSFSPRLTAQLLQAGLELTGKTDLRFIDTVYKVLREVFHYHPVLSKQQFLQSGFSQRKVDIVCDIISIALQRQNQLKKPRPRRPSSRSDHGVEVIPSPPGSGSAPSNVAVVVNGKGDVSVLSREPSHSPHTPDAHTQPAGEKEEDIPLSVVAEGRLAALEAKVEMLLGGVDRLKALEERLERLEEPGRGRDHQKNEEPMISVSRETWDNLLSRVLILEAELELSRSQVGQRDPSGVSEGKLGKRTTDFLPSCHPHSCPVSSGCDAPQEELSTKLDKIANMMKETSMLVRSAECPKQSGDQHP